MFPASLWFSFAFHAGFLWVSYGFPLGFASLWFSFAFHAGNLEVSSRVSRMKREVFHNDSCGFPLRKPQRKPA